MTLLSNHIILVAGEASGDLHAAHLVESLKKINPSLTFSGLGGPKMFQQGVEIYEDLTQVAVVGFTEVIKHISFFRRAFYLILEKIKERKPDCVILVDYPGFNLRLAKEIKKMGTKVFYYISPQVWAWKENRVEIIRKYVDKMLVIFPFEKEFFAKHGIVAEFVGHPFLETIKVNSPREALLSSVGLSENRLTIGLLPGSRPKEIERHLPVIIQTIKLIHQEFPQTQFLIMKAPSISRELLEKYTRYEMTPIRIIENKHYDGINACDLCLVCSGTATLEVGLLKKPMVVIYKTSFLSWLLAKNFIRIPCIAMVNVISGRKIVPECIQFDATPRQIANELINIFTNEPRIAEMKSELTKLKESLGAPGASKNAAEIILDSTP